MADRGFGEILGITRTTARIGDILGSASSIVPIGASSSIAKFANELKSSGPAGVKDTLLTPVGAAVGYFYGQKRRHKWLGLIGGASIGRNLPAAFLHAEERKSAMTNMATTAAGVAGSILMPKHRVLGFLGANIAANVLAYFMGYR